MVVIVDEVVEHFVYYYAAVVNPGFCQDYCVGVSLNAGDRFAGLGMHYLGGSEPLDALEAAKLS